jgi:chromosome segregation ATPase
MVTTQRGQIDELVKLTTEQRRGLESATAAVDEFGAENERLRGELEKVKAQLKEIRLERDVALTDSAQMEIELDEAQNMLSEAMPELDHGVFTFKGLLREASSRLGVRCDRYESAKAERAVEGRKLSSALTERDQAQAQLKREQATYAAAVAQIEQMRRDVEGIDELPKLRAEVTRLEVEYDHMERSRDSYVERLQDLREKHNEAAEEITKLRAEVARLEGRGRAAADEITRLAAHWRDRYEIELPMLHAEVARLEKLLGDANSAIARMKAETMEGTDLDGIERALDAVLEVAKAMGLPRVFEPPQGFAEVDSRKAIAWCDTCGCLAANCGHAWHIWRNRTLL